MKRYRHLYVLIREQGKTSFCLYHYFFVRVNAVSYVGFAMKINGKKNFVLL